MSDATQQSGMAPLFDPSQIQANVEAAPEAGFSPMRFGRVSMTPMVLRWVDENGIRIPKRSPLAPGQKLITGQETMELNFTVDIQEFSPNLQFTYERSVSVRNSRKSGDRLVEPTDWQEIVLPSLVKVLGKDWATRLLVRPYMQVEEVPNVLGRASKKSGKMFGVIKFVKVFPNKEACYAAFKEVTPAGGGVAADNTPAGVPAQVAKDVAELIAANGIDQVREFLASKPFGNYEVDAVLAAAGQ